MNRRQETDPDQQEEDSATKLPPSAFFSEDADYIKHSSHQTEYRKPVVVAWMLTH
jgi:hypothetical protein